MFLRSTIMSEALFVRKVLVFGEFLNHAHPKFHGLIYKKLPMNLGEKKAAMVFLH